MPGMTHHGILPDKFRQKNTAHFWLNPLSFCNCAGNPIAESLA
jgi:hypothetical protein